MARWKTIWIAELLISAEVDRKIRLKHGLSAQFLISEFVAAREVSGKVLYDPTNGERLMVAKLKDPLPRVTIFLNAVDLDYSIWSVRTAFFSRKSN